MDTLTSLFNTICEILNGTRWFQQIQTPFWTLLFILALSGIYTARFGKGKLLTLGFQGALKLVIIYMIAAAGYVWFPSFMSKFSQFPFLSVSDKALALINPLALLDRWNSALPRVLVRLYFLLFFINAVSVFDYNPPNFLSWFFFQVISGLISVGVYAGLSFAITSVFSNYLTLFYNITAILIVLSFIIMIVLKFYFAFVAKGDDKKFQKPYKFLTEQKFGSQFTVSALSFLLCVIYLVLSSLSGHDRMEFGSFTTIAYILNSIMCTLTLYVFSRYYNGK